MKSSKIIVDREYFKLLLKDSMVLEALSDILAVDTDECISDEQYLAIDEDIEMEMKSYPHILTLEKNTNG